MKLRDGKKLQIGDFQISELGDLREIVAPPSVKHLVSPKLNRAHPKLGLPRLPPPTPLRPKTTELNKLRASSVWSTKGATEGRLEQMTNWFPNMPRTPNPKKEPEDVDMADFPTPSAPRQQTSSRPTSNIGIFSKLPGELRNRIYRLAVIEPSDEPVKVVMESGTCSQGTCLHSKLSYNIPGIANTCRQMRWEALSIFCNENVAFEFDDGMVHQCCVGIYLRTLGHYADDIPIFRFILKRPIWSNDRFIEFATYTFVLIPWRRAKEEGGEIVWDNELKPRTAWTLEQHEEQNRKVCQCSLDKLVQKMNDRADELPVGKEVIDFADSEEFADFVWRMRKSKQWPQFLAKCEKCKEVIFNN